MDDYLRIEIQVLNRSIGDDGMIIGQRKLYTLDHVTDNSYHSYLTMEIMDMLTNIRAALKEHQP